MAQPTGQAFHATLGGWSEVPVSNENTALLLKSLSKKENYAAAVVKPVCVKQATRVRHQVVAGMNYLFEVNGCAVPFSEPESFGACAGRNANCHAAPFEIAVFSQPWTQTLRVERISWLD